MTQDSKPVFVRIRGAQTFDSFFSSLASRIEALDSGTDKLSVDERAKIISFATQKMQEVVAKYIQRQTEDMQAWKSIEQDENANLEVYNATA